MRLRFGPSQRISRRKEIALLFDQGLRASDSLLTVLAMRNQLDHCRAMVAVSRRHGGAVRRNRAKRLCREAFRLSAPLLPAGWDLAMIPRAAADLSLQKLRGSLVRLTRKLADSIESGHAPSADPRRGVSE